MGVSLTVPCYYFNCTPYGYSWDKNAPHVYELIVENINYLWLLSIYDILVHKQNNYHVKNHFILASSFCVVMKKQNVSLLYSVYPTVVTLNQNVI